jgi:CRP-like cAMP-binding protein
MVNEYSIYSGSWQKLFCNCPVELHKKGAVIIEEGCLLDKVYCIRSGKIKFSVITVNGDEKTIYYLNRGGIIGDVWAIAGRKYAMTATAVSGCTLSWMNPHEFMHKLRGDPNLFLEWMNYLSEIVGYLVEHITDIAFLDCNTLACKYIDRLALNYGVPTPEGLKIDSELTHQMLAELVGCTRVTISQIMSKLEKKKILFKKKGRFFIADRAALKREAGSNDL